MRRSRDLLRAALRDARGQRDYVGLAAASTILGAALSALLALSQFPEGAALAPWLQRISQQALGAMPGASFARDLSGGRVSEASVGLTFLNFLAATFAGAVVLRTSRARRTGRAPLAWAAVRERWEALTLWAAALTLLVVALTPYVPLAAGSNVLAIAPEPGPMLAAGLVMIAWGLASFLVLPAILAGTGTVTPILHGLARSSRAWWRVLKLQLLMGAVMVPGLLLIGLGSGAAVVGTSETVLLGGLLAILLGLAYVVYLQPAFLLAQLYLFEDTAPARAADAPAPSPAPDTAQGSDAGGAPSPGFE